MVVYWGEKRFNSLDYSLKEKFGEKVYKVAIDAGFTCPNRDGKISSEGCIFCSEKGSGDFAISGIDLVQQFHEGASLISRKCKSGRYIAYLQSFTNTYGNIDELRDKYYSLLNIGSVCGVAISTRPDCLDDDIIELLSEINKVKYLWVELGLQTSKETTAEIINRGYKNEVYLCAAEKLAANGIDAVAHVILGLPGESKADMLNTVDYAVNSKIKGIKFHLLHLIKGTRLEELYNNGALEFLEMDEYIDLIVDCIERIPKNIVIHRVTGDGPQKLLIGPLWSVRKKEVLNSISRRFTERDTWQGKLIDPHYVND